MFLKNRNIISKIKRSKVTDYAALSEKVIVDEHGRDTALHFGVKAKENQDKVPTLYW